jgi:hypothetical protein
MMFGFGKKPCDPYQEFLDMQGSKKVEKVEEEIWIQDTQLLTYTNIKTGEVVDSYMFELLQNKEVR